MRAFKHGPSAPWVINDEVAFAGAGVEVQSDIALMSSTIHPLSICIRPNCKPTKQTHDNGGEYLSYRCDDGSANLLLAYSKDRQRAIELTKVDGQLERTRAADYYRRMLSQSKLETPVKNLNDAFRSA